MIKVLVVEDSPEIVALFQLALGDTFELTFATTAGQARDHLARDRFDALVMDGQLGPDDPEKTTLRLITATREGGFAGPIIAMSVDERMRTEQVIAGCSHIHTSKADPLGLEELIKRALGL